jgi:hypothetical protein
MLVVGVVMVVIEEESRMSQQGHMISDFELTWMNFFFSTPSARALLLRYVFFLFLFFFLTFF